MPDFFAKALNAPLNKILFLAGIALLFAAIGLLKVKDISKGMKITSLVLGVALIILGLFVTYKPVPTVHDEKVATPSAELFPLSCREVNNLRSESGDFEVSLEFANNRRTGPVSVTWIDYNGRESSVPMIQRLGSGESAVVTTYLSHAFVVKDAAGGCVEAFKVGGRHLMATIGEQPVASVP